MAPESPLPQTSGSEAARLLKLASDHIADYFDALPVEQQDTPSGAEGWGLGDLIAHMSGGTEGTIRDVSRALKGDAGPLPEAPFRKTGPDPEGRARVAQRGRESREQQADALSANFRERNAQLFAILDGLTEEQWELPCFHVLQVTTIRGLTLTRIAEIGLHSWDLKSGIEIAPRLFPDVVPTLLEWMPTWFTWGFDGQEQVLEKPLRYRFQVGEPLTLSWDVVNTGSGFHFETPSSDPALATFRSDPETMALVFLHRLPWKRANAQGLLKIDGELAEVETFFKWFTGR